ncbi:MAG: TAXI family TRAP transporter solute-binding subunit [Rhodospirillaceae bacterium]|nr:TAXI family TRAP transporter solute-binding subunit [Rhodospirillaceae bacterium]
MNIRLSKYMVAAFAAAFVFAATTGTEAAEKRYTLGSLGAGTTPFLVNTAWAKAVNKYVPGHKIQVSAVGAATKHQVLVAKRRMDFAMGAQVAYRLMAYEIGPFKKIKGGLAMTQTMLSLFSYPIGVYHAVVYENSGIKSYKDIKGKKVFLGPPAGVATRNVTMIVDAMTGLKPGKDFTQVKMGWGPAAQAFQDRKFDVWILPSAAPSPAISQLTLTNKVRLLPLDKASFSHPSWKKYYSQPARFLAKIDPKVYGKNLVNTEPVLTTGAYVGLVVRSDMDADLVYKMMKAFWDHIDEAHALSVQLKDTLTTKLAVAAMSGDVHPGAIRYWKEKGVKILKPYKLTMADVKKFKAKQAAAKAKKAKMKK